MSLFLGVDGGGTKTALCLIRDSGDVAAAVTVGSCYYLGDPSTGAGPHLVRDVLTEGLDALCERAGASRGDIDFALVGLPGYGEVSADVPVLDSLPHDVLGHGRYRVVNDVVCGWAGSLGGQDGVHVVAGTGSIAYGQRDGREARVGGWGEVFGDEGSAYWIAVEGLRVFTMMSDGRAPSGPLADLLRDHLHLVSDLDLVDVVLVRWGSDRARIAALARVVTAAADLGDRAALDVVERAAQHLARLVVAADARLAALGAPATTAALPVSYSGGVFASPLVRDAVARHVSLAPLDDAGRYALRVPAFSPVVGAALHAAALAGHPLTDRARERLGAAQVAAP